MRGRSPSIPHVSRVARLLLTRGFPDREVREAITGDLDEELSHRCREVGDFRARVWGWRQVLGSCLYALGDGIHRPRSPHQTKESSMLGLSQDLAFAARMLRRNPGFALTVVLTISVGVAGATSMFSIFDTVVLRALPFPQPEELILVGEQTADGTPGNTGFETWTDWRAQSTSFQGLAMMRSWSPTLIDDGAERLQGVRVTWNALEILGARLALGRGFEEAEDRPDASRVVVISDRFWRTRFGADRDVLGRTVQLANTPYQVVGVLHSSFKPLLSEHLYAEAEIYAPLRYSIDLPWACRSCQHLFAFGRLRPEVSVQGARADLERVQRDLAERFPRDYSSSEIAIAPFQEAMVREARPALTVLLAAVVLLLLIACINVASLLLARGADRKRELAIRRALGAKRGRLVRQLMTESALLSLLGGALGLLLSTLTIPLLVRLSPTRVPRLAEVSMDPRVLGFALLATLASGLLFGLLPALGQSARSSCRLLSQRGGRGTGGVFGRRLSVVINLALALLLLMGAALTVKSFDRLLRTDPGFTLDGVLTAHFSLLGDRYEEDGVVLGIFDQILERVAALPGVEATAISGQIPLGGSWDSWGVEIAGRVFERAGDEISLQRYSVTPDYFETLGIPLVAGRLLDASDSAQEQGVMLLGESVARAIFPQGEALGSRIRFGNKEAWRTVVGVVGDVRHEGLGSETVPAMYLPQAQFTDRYVVLSARTDGAGSGLAESLRAAVTAAGDDIPIYDIAWLEDRAGESATRERFLAALLVGFAVLACFLAAIGLYGLIAFLVERRRSEVGVRIALGALRRDVAALVLRQGGTLVVLGLALGLGAALAATRLLQSLLYGIAPNDLGTYVQVAGGILLVALAAHLVPVWRAVRIDPAETLRTD